jgi:hypothetical protein
LSKTAPLGLESFRSAGRRTRFLAKDQAINYAQNRASFRSGEIRTLDSSGNVRARDSVRRQESKALIETHDHKGEFKEP